MKEKHFYPIAIFLAFLIAFAYVPQFHRAVVYLFEGSALSDKAALANKGGGRGNKQPVNFVSNVSTLSVDAVNKKIKGIGLTGSHTARDFLYRELEYDLSTATVEDTIGNPRDISEITTGKKVYIHGKNNRDGTFNVEKVVIHE